MNSGTKTIAICNEKGGVGKTTTTVTLGATLTARGYRVLLVDADPQGSLTDALGWKNQNDIMVSLSGKLQEEVSGVEYDPKEGILHTPEGMDLMPATLELAGMERLLINEMSREFILKGYLERLEGQYDYILIDCSPSLGLITLNALTASDSVLIPVQAQYLPAKGMVQLLTTVARTRQRLNRNLKIDGIFLTMVDQGTIMARETREALQESYGGKIRIMQTEIPRNTKIAEAAEDGISVLTYAPHCSSAEAYQKLPEEVLEQE